MSIPAWAHAALRVEVAFDDPPTEPNPVWTMIDPGDVLSFQFTEGRQSEAELTTQPGGGSLVLDNKDRTYDPTHTSGPYYGKLDQFRQVRVLGLFPARPLGASHHYDAFDAADAYTTLFRGFVNAEGWQQRDYLHPQSSRCHLSLLDPLGYMAARPVPTTLFEDFLTSKALAVYKETGDALACLFSPLGDNDDSCYYAQRIDLRRDRQSSQFETRASYNGDTTGVSPGQPYAPTSAANSAVTLRGSSEGSFDSTLGNLGVQLWRDIAQLSTGSVYDRWSMGFACRWLGFPLEDDTTLLGYHSLTFFYGWYMQQDGSVTFTSDNKANEYTVIDEIELGKDYFLSAAWDGTTLTLMVDGVVVVSDTPAAHVAGTATSTLQAGTVQNNSTFTKINRCPPLRLADFWYVGLVPITPTEGELLYRLWRGAAGAFLGGAVGFLLDALGFTHTISPTAGRLATSEITDQAIQAPSLLQQLEQTELGRLVYRHSAERFELITLADILLSEEQTVPQGTFSDDPGDFTQRSPEGALLDEAVFWLDAKDAAGVDLYRPILRYSNPEIVTIPLRNLVTASNSTGSRRWADLDSVALRGYGEFSVSLRSEVEPDLEAVAQFIADRFAAPRQVIRRLTLSLSGSGEFEAAWGLRIGALYRIKRHPHQVGNPVTIDAMLVGRSLVAGGGTEDWIMDLFFEQLPEGEATEAKVGVDVWSAGISSSTAGKTVGL